MRDSAPRASEGGTELKAGAMSVGSIVFIVVATAAPLTSMAAAMPVAVAIGNGVGMPGTYLLAGCVLALFAIGYAAMSRHMTNAGAFFAYITVGLGRRFGMAGGLVAVLAYVLLTLYVVGLVGFFGNLVFLTELDLDIPWEVFSFGLLIFALAIGIRGIELSARLLGVMLILETGLLFLLDIATLITEGPGAFTLHALNPDTIFSGAPGIAFMFAFLSFIGFEATAIFGEEAEDPKRTVPRATMFAIGFITFTYLVSSWSIIAANGGDAAAALALEDPGNFTFNASASVLGEWSAHLMSWLLLTSLIALLMAIHNISSRYFMAFGREGVLPRALGRTHPRFKTPYLASVVQAAIVAAVVAVYALSGADPYLDLGNQTAGVGSLGVIALMAITSIAVIGFFWRRHDRNWWKHVIAPALAFCGLTAACYLILDNYELLTGSTSDLVNGLPWLLVIVALIGFVIGSLRPLRTPLDVFGTADGEPGGVHEAEEPEEALER